MQNFIDLVKSRRSVRSYKKTPLTREELELCVEAARYAPSSCNSQPWKFIIVDDPATCQVLAKKSFSGITGINTFAHDAAAFIVIVSERLKTFSWLGEKIKNTDFRKIDIGIACEHVVLQAQELGIGTCILGWFDEKKLKKILSVPPLKKVELIIAMGRPSPLKKPEKQLKNKTETVSFNKY